MERERLLLYKIWHAMKQRCYNPNNEAYPNYGGRGIKVCDRWLESFDNFLIDIGKRPRGYLLDREDNDGDYTLENCRWVTRQEQQDNRRIFKNNVTGHVGVGYIAHLQKKKWRVTRQVNGKPKYIGSTHTKEEAISMYHEASDKQCKYCV